MRKKTRNFIFISTVVVFLIASPLLVLRIQGIRFDFEQKKFVKTGGVFVNVLNPNVKIYLDGELKKKTNFISNSAFIKNLLPRNYKIEVKKSGYNSWQKTLFVNEGTVTEAKNIILFKKNPQLKILSENIEDFLISEDGRELLVKKIENEKWKFLILNLSTNEWQEIISTGDLRKENITLKIVEWNSEQKQILFKEEEKLQNLFVVNYNLVPQIQIISFSLPEEVEKITFNPINPDEILFLKENGLFRQNLKTEKKESLFISDVVWFEKQKANLFFLAPSGFLIEADLAEPGKEILNKTPFSLSPERDFKVKTTKRGLFLKIGKELYRLMPDEELEKIAADVENFESSPDSEKLTFWGRQEIWILKKNGITDEEKPVFLCRFSETPNSLVWLNPYYLILNIGDEIKITEIDNRDYLNIVTLKTFKNPKINFNGVDKKLYILSEGNLFASEKLIP